MLVGPGRLRRLGSKCRSDQVNRHVIDVTGNRDRAKAGDDSLGGLPEPPTVYVRYCIKSCDWNSFRFKPRSKEEKRKALEKLLSLPKLKGKLTKEDRAFFEEQIK